MFKELFKEYANKNSELRAIAKTAYEFGYTIAQEPSAGMSLGLDEHALTRQTSYVDTIRGMIEAIHKRPIPDLPYVHPLQLPIDFTKEYLQFTVDDLPINEDTQLIAEYWMMLAVSLAKSQSAGLAGSLIDADYNRAVNHLNVITQYLDEMALRPVVDLPETAFPEAGLNPPRPARSKTK
jgi:hypothetical protein